MAQALVNQMHFRSRGLQDELDEEFSDAERIQLK